MADILIFEVPADVVIAIDVKAGRLGLSRTEYIRRILTRERSNQATEVTVGDLLRFSELFQDLADPEVMLRAWT